MQSTRLGSWNAMAASIANHVVFSNQGDFQSSQREMNENEDTELFYWAYVTQKRNCRCLRDHLEAAGLYDRSKPITHLDHGRVALAIRGDRLSAARELSPPPCDARLQEVCTASSAGPEGPLGRNSKTQSSKLSAALKALATGSGATWTPEMEASAPTRWERHGDLILLHSNAFQHEQWTAAVIDAENLWRTVANALSAEKVAIKEATIANDAFRTPRIRLLLGGHGWVTHVDNGIKYTYDVTKCMFSAGNVSEKLRVAAMRCDGEVVVDMYAGIGYFTLPFLVHARAALVHACDWNAHSIEALERTLVENGVRDRCVVHFGDNREVTPEGVAQRVCLGLIPSSEPGWKTACKALNPSTGGVLHVHGNVTSSRSIGDGGVRPHTVDGRRRFLRREWVDWANGVASHIRGIFASLYTDAAAAAAAPTWVVSIEHTERVKSYAPHVDHLVVDLRCSPVRGQTLLAATASH